MLNSVGIGTAMPDSAALVDTSDDTKLWKSLDYVSKIQMVTFAAVSGVSCVRDG